MSSEHTCLIEKKKNLLYATSVPVNCSTGFNMHPVQSVVDLSQERRKMANKGMSHVQNDSGLVTNNAETQN